MSVREVEPEHGSLVEMPRDGRSGWRGRPEPLAGVALEEDRIGPSLPDDARSTDGTGDDVRERGDERSIARLLLIPPALVRREERRDEGLVDRRVPAHPGIALGEGPYVGHVPIDEPRIRYAGKVVGHGEMEE